MLQINIMVYIYFMPGNNKYTVSKHNLTEWERTERDKYEEIEKK